MPQTGPNERLGNSLDPIQVSRNQFRMLTMNSRLPTRQAGGGCVLLGTIITARGSVSAVAGFGGVSFLVPLEMTVGQRAAEFEQFLFFEFELFP